MKQPEPDRRLGGTFVREKDGTLVSHTPPTAPTEADKQARDAAAQQTTTSTAAPADDTPTARSTRRGS